MTLMDRLYPELRLLAEVNDTFRQDDAARR